MSSRIYSVVAHEILDSRGTPTVEATVILESGYRGTASVPAGASKGKYEAVELRDGDPKRYNGMGVLRAVANVNTVIGPHLKGKDAANQRNVDLTILALDGTPNKINLGANSVLAVSLATAVAAAEHQRIPLYRYINFLFGGTLPKAIARMPTPTFNLINGGLHGAGNLDFQEFHIVPATTHMYHDALRMGEEIYYAVKNILIARNAIHSVGDEGGFAPNLSTNLDAMEVLVEAIRLTPYKFGIEVFLGLDLAATHFKTERGYEIKDQPTPLSSQDLIRYLAEFHKKYRLLLLEDPLEEDDWPGWTGLTAILGDEVHIVGDDLLATNPGRLKRAIAEKACNSILLKPNQIGTLSEYLDVVRLARENNIQCIVSHRSGETNDTFVADLAVAVQADYVKFGAPARGERVAKYNRLLAIESQLFPGSS